MEGDLNAKLGVIRIEKEVKRLSNTCHDQISLTDAVIHHQTLRNRKAAKKIALPKLQTRHEKIMDTLGRLEFHHNK